MVYRKVLLFCILGMFIASISRADIINLGDIYFYADPTVTVAVDELSAIIEEDPSLGSAILSNDPYFGYPQVIFPGLYYLFFDYSFTEGVGNNDEFVAFVIDPFTGGSIDPSLEFYTGQTGSGTVMFDLSGLSSGLEIGLQFELYSYDSAPALDSMVSISNVHTEPIPEPGTILLMLSGLSGFLVYAQVRRRKT